ncbi:transcriptional regulator [Xanthomonas campestris]|uniref:transcriptional regulator n=1 Tax=Xanthomonas campestris TaxID=339 RepID=UPI00388EAE42
METPIQTAIRAAGGQRALANALNVHPAMVSQWATARRPVAAHHVLVIETCTGVSRHALRPDVFGPIPKTQQQVA